MTQQAIVVTSIFPPTEGIGLLAKLPGWRLIVAGDRKSPMGWSHPGVQFLSADEQAASSHALAKVLPWNHYCRKLMGYLAAMEQGADLIFDTDDDNLPKPDWDIPAFSGSFPTTSPDRGFVNVYRYFTAMKIWPRGFPLNLLADPTHQLERSDVSPQQAKIGVWQGLADEDPDVDAVYRLVDNTPCFFDAAPPFVLAPGTISPWNSQNTVFRRELFPLLYLPATVTFRFTDILRSLVAQPIMWAAGWQVGFTHATVVQKRNPHNYLKDFESEIPCYLQGPAVVEKVAAVVKPERTMSENLRHGYEALVQAGIVPAEELPILDAWLADVNKAG